MLFYTGMSRIASDVAAEQIQNVSKKVEELNGHAPDGGSALDVLAADNDLTDFGRLLHETWLLKKSLATGYRIRRLIAFMKRVGGWRFGGKLLGREGEDSSCCSWSRRNKRACESN